MATWHRVGTAINNFFLLFVCVYFVIAFVVLTCTLVIISLYAKVSYVDLLCTVNKPFFNLCMS